MRFSDQIRRIRSATYQKIMDEEMFELGGGLGNRKLKAEGTYARWIFDGEKFCSLLLLLERLRIPFSI